MDLKLTNKNVLITGGSNGIGYALAEAFLGEGANVLIAARNKERLDSAASNLRAQFPQGKLSAKECDVTRVAELETLAQFADSELGGVDVLINHAGGGTDETVMNAPDDKWYYNWDLHVMSAVRLSRMLHSGMAKRAALHGEAVIINTTSKCAVQPLWYEPIYNVTKAALAMFSKCLSDEFAKDKVRVLAIAPSMVLTPDWMKTSAKKSAEQGISQQEFLDNLAKNSAAIGRFATPEEVANLYLFAASPRASYLLGTSVHIHGGAIKSVN
ncbi:MAG: SDR family oxidoreductase [Spirochaetaceae bacterium]|jgi:NAD(P)-dependent dehydrogenase (short-subunit alcohol dehydrogenase family)|nr:SDR family oxidoreductase [Spirochaetaceae bacterium]